MLFDSDFFSDGLRNNGWDFGWLGISLIGLVSSEWLSISDGRWRVSGDGFILWDSVSLGDLLSSESDFGGLGGS